jgi:hypothetical protein
VAAITLGLLACGYYAPPIRSNAPDAARAEPPPAASDDAMRPAEAPSEDSDD